MIIYDFRVISSVENLTKECLGYAEDVYEHVLVNIRSFSLILICQVFIFRAKKNLLLSKVVNIRDQ